MKVAEFIEWLKTQDQEAIVECVVHESNGSYYEQGGTCTTEEFTEELSEYTDFRGNEYVKSSQPYYNKRYLLVGVD